jgi:hypothetical protein
METDKRGSVLICHVYQYGSSTIFELECPQFWTDIVLASSTHKKVNIH